MQTTQNIANDLLFAAKEVAPWSAMKRLTV